MAFYDAFTLGMTPTPMTPAERRRHEATFVANKTAQLAAAEVFRNGGTIEAANAASSAAYAAVMALVEG